MPRLILALSISVGLLLAACEVVETTEPSEEETPNVDAEEPPPAAQPEGQDVYVNLVEVLLLESFPLQAQAVVQGELADGCVSLMGLESTRIDNTFTILVNTEREQDVACTEALVPFEETVALDILGLEAGTYTVVAGEQSTSFVLDIDNIGLELEPNPNQLVETSAPVVEAVEIRFIEGTPLQAEALVTGTTSGACDMVSAGAERDGTDFIINLVALTDPAVDCIEGPGEFSDLVYVDIVGLEAGTYTLTVGEISVDFTLVEDNTQEEEPTTLGNPLPVGNFSIELGVAPGTALVKIQVIVPNGCVEYLEVTEQREGYTIALAVYQNVPSDVACIQVLTDYEVTYELTGLESGVDYTIAVTDMARLFTPQ